MGTELYPAISNIAINTSTFTEVPLPSGVSFSGFEAKTRDDDRFQISDTAAGTNYYTILLKTEEDIKGSVGSPLFYARAIGAATTLEVLFKK